MLPILIAEVGAGIALAYHKPGYENRQRPLVQLGVRSDDHFERMSVSVVSIPCNQKYQQIQLVKRLPEGLFCCAAVTAPKQPSPATAAKVFGPLV